MELAEILTSLNPTPSGYISAERSILADELDSLSPLNLAVLSTYTFEMVRPYLVVECAGHGLLPQTYFAPFNQLEQQVFDTNSGLYRSKPDVIAVAWRIEELAPNLGLGFASLSSTEVTAELQNLNHRIEALLAELRRNTSAAILAFNFGGPMSTSSGMSDTSLETSQASAIQKANGSLTEACKTVAGVYVFDYARLVQETGTKNWYDQKIWHMARMPLGYQAQMETGKRLSRYLRALVRPTCKCLVLDCDNTLWGGVVGDDGLGGIQLGEDFPGNVYKEFQRKLLSLKHRGILLALASKNSEEDVLEVFDQHPDSLLKREDFAAIQIHWNDKASSLRAIAEELNIGTDALAFFDDNPVERDWVSTQMPEVNIVEVPGNPLGYISAIDDSVAFDSLFISDEDRARPAMYQEQVQRQSLQKQSVSVREFLESLEMKVTVGFVNSKTLPRVTQLLNKTNQFNLTTRRHTESELQSIIDSNAVAIWIRVSDRFGDNGLVGVAIASPLPEQSGTWILDTVLMSCRVLGREVDTAMLSIVGRFVAEKGGTSMVGEYVPTAKNGMVSEFYPGHGFVPVEGRNDLWQWDLASLGVIPWPKSLELDTQDPVGLGT